MPNRSNKTIDAPPSYESAIGADTSSHSISPGLDQLVRIIGNHERLHFHAPIGMGYFTVPEVVQIRDSNEQPILCIMAGRMIVSAGQSRIASSREIMTPSGETLISISPGTVRLKCVRAESSSLITMPIADSNIVRWRSNFG